MFNIIEGEYLDNKYNQYIQLYNEGVKTKLISEKLNLSIGKLLTFRKHALEEGLIKPRYKPKYYSKIKNGDYVVYSPTKDNGKRVNLGVYPSEAEAKYVVEELKKVAWNRKCLASIQLRAMKLFHQ